LSEHGIVIAHVGTALKLSESVREDIITMIKDTQHATKVHLSEYIDPGLILGFKVDLPGKQLDTTIARKLTALQTQYKK